MGYDMGGSSSGSAAAVAANFAMLAVAEDTVRTIPSSMIHNMELTSSREVVSAVQQVSPT
jgi:Asp-tRNA(Asn)/Glu-tRNA(Gln) amidotransferase A subunit family amidase